MPWRVDEIQLVSLPIPRAVMQGHALRLDGDATLPLQIHRIQHLIAHFPFAKPSANLNESVGQRGLAMIDMSDDRKITDMLHVVRVKTKV